MPSTTGLHILHDSGAPHSNDYTTVVIVHGSGYHCGIFANMLSYAEKHNARLVLVNRCDYPGAKQYSKEARRLLSPGTVDLDARKSSISLFIKDRALEFIAFLMELARDGDTPPARPRSNTGGVVLVGWSTGAIWMNAFLAHVSLSPHGRALREYVRRVILYDPPSTAFGYPRPRTAFDFVMRVLEGDPQRDVLPDDWFSGYFAHGSTVDTFEYKTALSYPPPTLSNLNPAEKQYLLARLPTSRGGSDQILAFDGYRSGVLQEVWQNALYLPPSRLVTSLHYAPYSRRV